MNWCRIYGALDVKIALAESKRKLNLKYILKSSKGKRNYLCLYSRALGFSFFTCKCETWHRFATATLIDIHTYVLGGFHGLACYYMVFLWVISIYMHVVVNLAPRILLFLFWFPCCQTHHLRDFIYFVWTSPRPQDNYNAFSVLKTECVTSQDLRPVTTVVSSAFLWSTSSPLSPLSDQIPFNLFFCLTWRSSRCLTPWTTRTWVDEDDIVDSDPDRHTWRSVCFFHSSALACLPSFYSAWLWNQTRSSNILLDFVTRAW